MIKLVKFIYNLYFKINFKIYKYLISNPENKILFRLKFFFPLSIKAFYFYKKRKIYSREPRGTNDWVIHLIPEKTVGPSWLYLGSTKDIMNRIQYFQENKISTITVRCVKGDFYLRELLKVFFNKFVKDFDPKIKYIYIDIPGSYGHSIKWIKSNYPNLKVIFRSHNAEAYHRFERYHFYSGMKSYFSDILTIRHADSIHSISEYDISNYWNLLWFTNHYMRNSKIKYVPYFLTDNFYKEIDQKKEKTDTSYKFIIYGSVNVTNPTLNQALNSLSKNIIHTSNYKYTIDYTGNKSNINGGYLSSIGNQKSPLKILNNYNALFVLDSSGWGFKTKILEAILSGCFVIINSKMSLRVPLCLHPYLIYVDDNKIDMEKIINDIENKNWQNPEYFNNLFKKVAYNNYFME